MHRLVIAFVALVLAAAPAHAQHLLVPMDRDQSNHLRAYGLTYWVLESGRTAEWLLNYRSGAFLLPDEPDVRREAALRGITAEPLAAIQVADLRAIIEDSNMESIILEKAPKIAVYTATAVTGTVASGNANPWDDAVILALEYAQIPFDRVWDADVLQGRLSEYEWLHLHHEDFTGQYSKFYISHAGSPWLQEAVRLNQGTAREFGYSNVPALKQAVSEQVAQYVAQGGFVFAMCTATETIELALAGAGVDIAAAFSDGTGIDPDATAKMQWNRTLAFEGAEIQTNAGVNAFSDIDGHQVNTPWRQPLGAFTLFDFSPKFDPVPSMLVQNHENVVGDFYGLTTSFRRDRIKSNVIVLAEEEGAPWTKYIHGNFGEGTFTFYGGHDPEDPQHQIGDSPTDLSEHPNSPGYRLILNNVLFPAAKKKTLKTD